MADDAGKPSSHRDPICRLNMGTCWTTYSVVQTVAIRVVQEPRVFTASKARWRSAVTKGAGIAARKARTLAAPRPPACGMWISSSVSFAQRCAVHANVERLSPVAGISGNTYAARSVTDADMLHTDGDPSETGCSGAGTRRLDAPHKGVTRLADSCDGDHRARRSRRALGRRRSGAQLAFDDRIPHVDASRRKFTVKG